jgi:phosphate/sulfate permease
LLDPRSGLYSDWNAGVNDYAMIGGIASVGLLKGVKAVRIETPKRVVFNWFFAPSFSFLLSFLAAKVLFH